MNSDSINELEILNKFELLQWRYLRKRLENGVFEFVIWKWYKSGGKGPRCGLRSECLSVKNNDEELRNTDHQGFGLEPG